MTITAATVTEPIAVTAEMLVACSIAEPDLTTGEETYDSGETYEAEDLVISTVTHRTFISLQDSNLNKPLPVWPATETAWWRDVGATNRWRSLDLTSNAPTVGEETVSWTIAPGMRVSALGLFGAVADNVRIEAILDGDTIDDDTYVLRTFHPTTWEEYFATTSVRHRAAFWSLELPIHTQMQYRITLTRAAGDLSAGSLLLGIWENLGDMRFEAELGGDDFSLISRAESGEIADLVSRKVVPRVSFETIAPLVRIRRLREVKNRLGGKVAMWLPVSDPDDDLAEALATLGIGRRFDIPTNTSDVLFIPFEVEAL